MSTWNFENSSTAPPALLNESFKEYCKRTGLTKSKFLKFDCYPIFDDIEKEK